MLEMDAGDLVRSRGATHDMLVIGRADEPDGEEDPAVFCVWEQAHFLHQQVFLICDLEMVRKERRRVPRNGCLDFPSR